MPRSSKDKPKSTGNCYSASELTKLGFDKVGEVVLDDLVPRIQLRNPTEENGWVYAWAEVSEGKYSVVYVGMAGKTLRARFAQHNGGFKRSVTGKAHAKRFLDGFRSEKQYVVFARKSGVATILDEENIPLQVVEELALIKKFSPPWNS